MAEPEAGWLTVTEIARRLGRPLSTVVYWRNTFRDQLDERQDDHGHARYALAIFERIDVMLRQRTSRAEIRRALTGHQREGPTESRDDLILAELRAIREAVERIANHLAPEDD